MYQSTIRQLRCSSDSKATRRAEDLMNHRERSRLYYRTAMTLTLRYHNFKRYKLL